MKQLLFTKMNWNQGHTNKSHLSVRIVHIKWWVLFSWCRVFYISFVTNLQYFLHQQSHLITFIDSFKLIFLSSKLSWPTIFAVSIIKCIAFCQRTSRKSKSCSVPFGQNHKKIKLCCTLASSSPPDWKNHSNSSQFFMIGSIFCNWITTFLFSSSLSLLLLLLWSNMIRCGFVVTVIVVAAINTGHVADGCVSV